ncbi:MAG TPA: HNH endonuclease, partial [Pyrinomonadaceae bacterium]|nr:HNH endonuclease [Pyrinomonadaceae bacterium]
VPSVIRRRTYINVRRRREASGMKRLRLYMRDKFRCQYCGDKKGAAELTLDHILPRSRGGDNSPVNIVTACVPCNNRKSNRTPDEARMPLLTSQTALRMKLERVVLCHYAEARAEWRKYLFMDVHDDRDVMERVHAEQKRRA